MKTILDYILKLRAVGEYFFSKEKALLDLGLSERQFHQQIFRLRQKRAIQNLVRGFYMIIPPEYSHLGSLPAEWIIDPLMKFLHYDYYIGLLSAAALYGSTQQQPMVFQVVTNKRMKIIKLKRGNIDFHYYKEFSLAIKEDTPFPTGYAKISSKEQTLVDLVRFYKVCGYMSNVAHIIQDLGESCKTEALSKVVKLEKMNSVLQRLGYILEFGGHPELAAVVEQELNTRKIFETQLRPDHHIKTGERSHRWKLILNDTLELDE